MDTPERKNKKSIYILFFLLFFIVAIAAIWFYNNSRYISSDDAYINGYNYNASFQVSGLIVSEFAQEGDFVRKEAILAKLDSAEMIARKKENEARLQESKASVEQNQAQIVYQKTLLESTRIEMENAYENFKRAESLLNTGAITKQSYDNYQSLWLQAKAEYTGRKSQIKISEMELVQSESSVAVNLAALKLNEIQLGYLTLYAPSDGFIAKRWALSGEVVNAARSIYTIADTSFLWVTVMLEETKIRYIEKGKQVHFNVDAFPGRTFWGKVFEIGTNTASQFALIPPSNASGNFTKVTQRIQVRISIDGVDKGDLSSYRLIRGMSVEIKIRK